MEIGKVRLGNLKNRKGSAIVLALVVFMIVFIIAGIVYSLFNSNLKMARNQEFRSEAYYLAYSGVEMAFTALIADNNDLFNKIASGVITKLDSKTDPNTDRTGTHIIFENGYIDFVVTKSNDVKYVGWIKIVSTGTMSLSNISYTRTLYIDPSNQKNIAWQDN